jgi:hypothetical protein
MTSFRWCVLCVLSGLFVIFGGLPQWARWSIIGFQFFCLYKQITFKESPENGQEKTREQ